MDQKRERPPAGERPKERSIRVPGQAGLYKDPSKGIVPLKKEDEKTLLRVEDVFELEPKNGSKEREDWARIGWNPGDVREFHRLLWYYAPFKDKETGITRIAYIATRKRTDSQRDAGKPIEFLSPEGFIPGPSLEAGLQYEFVVRERPVSVTKTGKRI